MLKSVCHNVVLVKGGRAIADKGQRRGGGWVKPKGDKG